jgi:hypothetical protein
MGWNTKFIILMAYNTFAPIVNTNLVLCLDSANTKSYPGTGSSFYDLTLNANNFNFATTPPTFAGVLNFDGVTDYGTMSYNSIFDLSTTSFTIEGYFMSNSFASGQCLVSKDTYGSNFDWGLVITDSTTLTFWSAGSATDVTATVPAMLTGRWYHYVVTANYGVSNDIRIYLNGVLYQGPTTMSVTNSSQISLTVGALGGITTQTYYLNGSLSTVRVYKYRLTDDQILQNYTTLKNRFI